MVNINSKINPRKILFVCTGNVFRSMSAKHCLEDYIKKNNIKDTFVDSAGIVAKKCSIRPAVAQEMLSFGIDVKNHKQKKLTKADLENYDLIIAMAESHVEFIKNNFGFNEAVLFNEIVNNEKTSVKDVNEAILDWENKKEESDKYVKEIVRYIHKNTKKLYNNLDKYMLFLDFINNRRNQKYGFDFSPIYETKKTIAFMSIAIPQKEDGHILVIPKKRYMCLDNIPEDILKELIVSVTKIGKVLKKTHGGYNVLLNNGFDAGQRIFHTHFHIIPRNKNDFISIETWKSKRLTKDKFNLLNNKLKELVRGSIHTI